ncbi:MAG: type I-E CRISPR-associated protein Cse2/CasB [Planctomyces sp.]|jgi:CRISPR type I-E-associated protein CasB/Cse2
MSSRSSEVQPWQDAFVSALEGLERDHDRGALAELRRGRGRAFGEHAARDGWVLRTLSRAGAAWDGGDRRLGICCLVASLFAQHSSPGGKGSLGTAFHRLATISPGAEQGAERRFHHLLDSEFEDLPERLRHAVSLLKAKEMPVDWRRMLADLCNWEWASRSVQKAWSRDFWAPVTHSEPAEQA